MHMVGMLAVGMASGGGNSTNLIDSSTSSRPVEAGAVEVTINWGGD